MTFVRGKSFKTYASLVTQNCVYVLTIGNVFINIRKIAANCSLELRKLSCYMYSFVVFRQNFVEDVYPYTEKIYLSG